LGQKIFLFDPGQGTCPGKSAECSSQACGGEASGPRSIWERARADGDDKAAKGECLGQSRSRRRRSVCAATRNMPEGEAPSRTSSGGLPEGFHLLPGGMPGAHGRARLCQGYRRRSVRRSLPHRAGPEPFRLHPRPLRSVAFMSALTPVPLRKTSRERRGRALSLPQQRPCWISLRRRSLRLGTALKRTDPDRLPDCVKKAFRSAWRRVGRVWI